MTIERKALPEQPYLYVDRETAMNGAEIAAAMGSGFAELFQFVEHKGVTPLSMPMAVYLAMPSGGRMAFQAAVFVSTEDADRAEGGIKSGVMPAGDAFTTTHVGPYTNLNQTHQALWSHMEAQGVTKGLPVWEIYVDDPSSTPEGELRTEIYRACDG